jgi:hypothetical protein
VGAARSAIRVGGSVFGRASGSGAQGEPSTSRRDHARTQPCGGVNWERCVRQRGRAALFWPPRLDLLKTSDGPLAQRAARSDGRVASSGLRNATAGSREAWSLTFGLL